MKRFLALWLMPALAFGQSVTVNTNNLPVSSANPLYTLTSSQKNPSGVPYVDGSGILSSYSVGGTFVPTTGVLVAICGSATKIVGVRGFALTGTAGQTGNLILNILKTSTAPTAGTAVPAVPVDSAEAAATATVWYYNAAPTPGTSLGSIFTFTQFFPTTTTGQSENQSPRELTPYPWTRPVILRGTNECLELSTASAALTTPSVQFTLAWTESNTFP